jgi:magnesium transporter
MLKAIYARAGEKPIETSSEADIAKFVKEGQGSLWVDFESPSDEERGILERTFNFHKLAVENCFAQSNHPRIDDYGDYYYLVVHGVAAMRGSTVTEGSRLRLKEIDVFLGEHLLVTYHAGVEAAIGVGAQEMRRGGPADGARPRPGAGGDPGPRGQGYVDHGGARLGRSTRSRTGCSSTRRPALRRSSRSRRTLHLRRGESPARGAEPPRAGGRTRRCREEETVYFRDVYDHIYRVAEMLESFRDVLSSSLEVYLTVVANRTNEVMKVLTTFSIVLMTGR